MRAVLVMVLKRSTPWQSLLTDEAQAMEGVHAIALAELCERHWWGCWQECGTSMGWGGELLDAAACRAVSFWQGHSMAAISQLQVLRLLKVLCSHM
jgi:hypothetical protein